MEDAVFLKFFFFNDIRNGTALVTLERTHIFADARKEGYKFLTMYKGHRSSMTPDVKQNYSMTPERPYLCYGVEKDSALASLERTQVIFDTRKGGHRFYNI